jgi:hypothetical protein
MMVVGKMMVVVYICVMVFAWEMVQVAEMGSEL